MWAEESLASLVWQMCCFCRAMKLFESCFKSCTGRSMLPYSTSDDAWHPHAVAIANEKVNLSLTNESEMLNG